MHILMIIVSLWAFTGVFAYPSQRSATADIHVFGKLWLMFAKQIADHLITLAFADVLEQLESAFYTQALKQFNASSFEMAGFASSQTPIQQIETTANEENAHVIAIQVCEYRQSISQRPFE